MTSRLIEIGGGYNLGSGLGGLIDRYDLSKKEQQQNQEKQQMQSLFTNAATGDSDAMSKLWGINPKAAEMFENREIKKINDLGLVKAKESKKAEVDWGLRWTKAQTPDQKQILLDEALSNPLIDIDEEDVSVDSEQKDLAVNYMLYGHLGKDAYKDLIGGSAGNKKLSNIQKTQGGELIGQDDAGNWVKADLPSGVSLEKKQPLVSIGNQQTEEQKSTGKYRGDAFNAILKNSTQANKSLATLNTMNNLSADAFEGTMAGAKLSLGRLAKAFGMDVDGLTESEVFDSLANDLTLGKAGQLAGAMSDKDIEFLQATVPQLSQTKDGRKKLISIMKEVANIEKGLAKQARVYKSKNKGTFDPIGFEEWVIKNRGGKDMLSKYFEGTAVLGEEIVLPSGAKVKRIN